MKTEIYQKLNELLSNDFSTRELAHEKSHLFEVFQESEDDVYIAYRNLALRGDNREMFAHLEIDLEQGLAEVVVFKAGKEFINTEHFGGNQKLENQEVAREKLLGWLDLLLGCKLVKQAA